MTTTTEMLAFWLTPAPRERAFFASIIRELAARFDAPAFEPHITLVGGIVNDDRTLHVFRTLPVAPSYQLKIEGTFSATKYTKTFFIRFHLSDELRELRSSIAQALDLESEDDFDPHLSLLYKKMPLSERKELGTSVKIPFQRVSFEGFKLMAHPPKITTRAEVEIWREIECRRLTNAPD